MIAVQNSRYKSHKNGFILISTLLMLTLLSFVALFMLNSSLVLSRMSQGMLRYAQRESALMAGIYDGMAVLARQQRQQQLSCYQSVLSQHWWQSAQACQGTLGPYTYRFVISPLSAFTRCLRYFQIQSVVLGATDQVRAVTFQQIDYHSPQRKHCKIARTELTLLKGKPVRTGLTRLSWHDKFQ